MAKNKPFFGFILYFTVYFVFVNGFTYEEEDTMENLGIEKSPIKNITVLTGSKALLPCNVASSQLTDKPILVLFYKDPVKTPVYSLDARDGPLSLGTKWLDGKVFHSRVTFNLESSNPGLLIDTARPRDSALYRCRVDFKASPTRNARIHLDVIVPPKKISIVNEAGLEVTGVVGPYHLDEVITLKCIVEGGHPESKISWRYQPSNMQEPFRVIQSQTRDSSAILVLNKFTRQDLFSVYSCHAINSNLVSPMRTSVTIDLIFPPLELKLFGLSDPLKEGQKAKVSCEVTGSKPEADITWWKNGIQIINSTTETFEHGNLTRSTLEYFPEVLDEQSQLICRAMNPVIPMSVIETASKIRVFYYPRVKLVAGHGLNMDDIQEGDDVYFECISNANPRIHSVKWYHNGIELSQNASIGIIQSNQSLVLQKIHKQLSGNYVCVAFNTEGLGKSNKLVLSVKFKPFCCESTKNVYGAERNEAIEVSCQVKANPKPKQFRWAFNTSSDLFDLTWVEGESKKRLRYVPHSELDFGSLLCWAENEIGQQKDPCVFLVIRSSIPDPVRNCSIMNVTNSSAFILCLPGWGGGHDQSFTIQVMQKLRPLVAQISYIPKSTSRVGESNPLGIKQGGVPEMPQEDIKDLPLSMAKASPAPNPRFLLTGLDGGNQYTLMITAVNRKGNSQPVRVALTTLGDAAEKRISQDKDQSLPLTENVPVLIIINGTCVTVIIILVLLITIKVKKKRKSSERTCNTHVQLEDKKEEIEDLSSVGTSLNTSTEAYQDRTPDVIPLGNKSTIVAIEPSYQYLSYPSKDAYLKESIL